jgi:hypothetical protein
MKRLPTMLLTQNMVTMAPSPLVRKIMSKHDEDVGRICKKYIRVQLGLVRVDSTQQTIKKHVCLLKNTHLLSAGTLISCTWTSSVII